MVYFFTDHLSNTIAPDEIYKANNLQSKSYNESIVAAGGGKWAMFICSPHLLLAFWLPLFSPPPHEQMQTAEPCSTGYWSSWRPEILRVRNYLHRHKAKDSSRPRLLWGLPQKRRKAELGNLLIKEIFAAISSCLGKRQPNRLWQSRGPVRELLIISGMAPKGQVRLDCHGTGTVGISMPAASNTSSDIGLEQHRLLKTSGK